MQDISEKNQDLNLNDSENKRPKILVAGPCVIEDWETSFEIAKELRRICQLYKFTPVFKGSWDKANRTSGDSFRSIGMLDSLNILSRIRKELGIFTITDVHETNQVEFVSKYVDFLQIPAFLSRQTDLIEACGKSRRLTLIKKGQFLSPEACKYIENKFYNSGGSEMIICERGNTFGYNDLVVDVTSISRLKESCERSIVGLDCTHSLQKPNGIYGKTEGNSKYIKEMVKYGACMDADVLFIETHPDPSKSPSDSDNMLKLSDLEEVVSNARKIYDL